MTLLRPLLAAALAVGLTGASSAQSTLTVPTAQQIPYDELAAQLTGRMDFEDLPVVPEPGLSYDQILIAPGLEIGEHLSGQTKHAVDGFDRLGGAPRVPLEVIAGGNGNSGGENLAVAFHAGLGSNAAFPLGPDGFARISGRGEGAMALVFADDIQRFGLKLHADYADPLGSRPPPGEITLKFYDDAGELRAIARLHPARGIAPYGFALPAPIRAITLTHDDPGGIAVDDIIYPLPALSS